MAEEAREKHRWGDENIRVYTRRRPSKIGNPIDAASNQPTATEEDAAVITTATADNNGTVTTATEGGGTVAPPQDSQASPAKEANSQSQQLVSPRTEANCDDSSGLNQEHLNGNGVIEPVRPVMMRIGDRINIHLSSATPKQEARELKRKLLNDLEQVKSLAKELEDKENQIQLYKGDGGLTSSAGDLEDKENQIQLYNGDGGLTSSAGFTGVGELTGLSLSQYSTSAGLANGAGMNDSRPFQRLSVSVMDIHRHGGGTEILEKEKRTPKANQFYQNSDFICGKERLPAETNRKQKSGGGGRKKQSSGGGSTEFSKQIFKKCGTLLQQLMKHKFGWVFNTPVDVKGLCLHDYYDVIKHPMDLGTVKNRLSKNWYKSCLDFAEDVRLTFRNAMTYNPEGQDVHVMAVELLNLFEEKWVEMHAEYSRKLRYEGLYETGLPTPQSRLAPLPFYGSPPAVHPEMKHLDRSESFALPVNTPKPVPVVSRAPAAPKKPKAKDPDKRDMTFEEKQKLSTHLQALPPEKLDNIVQIIKKRSSSVRQHDEEIEVDIDSVDAETLWELDRFVINYKKNLSKQKRKAEIALEKAQAKQAKEAPNPDLQRPVFPNSTAPGDHTNGAAVSNPDHEGKQTDNASNSSSSSSSSSDSGSSSSDSDSDSSSDSGSDGGE